MNGIEKILGRLQDDSQAEVNALLEEARQEAQAIQDQAAAQAAQIQADLTEKGRRAAEERRERLASVAEMEAKKQLLATKQDLLDRAFQLAHDKLAGLPQEETISLLASLAAAAARTGREEILLNEKDRAALGDAVVAAANEKLRGAGKPAGLTLADGCAPITGGVLVGDGSSEVNCSFDTLLRLSREELSGQAAQVLFP